MDFGFATEKLQKRFNEKRAMVRAFGPQRAKRLQIVLAALRAAPNLAVFAPPYSPPHRCHELTGNHRGKLTLDLDGPYRLLFAPLHDPLPERPEGGLDWRRVTAIKLYGVEDTHG